MHPYRLPIKFILLWIANLAVLVILGIVLEIPMPGCIKMPPPAIFCWAEYWPGWSRRCFTSCVVNR